MYSPATILTAQADPRLESITGGFQKNRAQFDSHDIVLFVSTLVVVFGVLWLVARWSERRVRNDSSLGLFWTLAKKHNVGWKDCWLLWRIARKKHVGEPALLFLDPRITSPQFLKDLNPAAAARLKSLRRRFFFGIDREAEMPGIGLDPEAETAGPAPEPPAPAATGPKEELSSKETVGELAEALGAIRALKLQEQSVCKETPVEEAPSDETEKKKSPSAEFPAADAPVLDLYPWLSNDWEITEAEE